MSTLGALEVTRLTEAAPQSPALQMQSSSSPAIDTGLPTGGIAHTRRPRSSAARGTTEVALTVIPFPYADVAPPSEVIRRGVPRDRSELASRVLNVVLATLAIVVLLPVFLVIAIAIRLTSPGPILYTQTRVGVNRRWRRRAETDDRRAEDLGGRPFTIYKFRSMSVHAEPDGQAVWAARNDERVTTVGRVLRKLRLDELPQLVNVLKGEMNIVGPRPERPCIFGKLSGEIPEYRWRQSVKPGITGWAQVNQQYDACIEDVRRKVHYDLEYIRRQGVAEDLRILALTVPFVLFKRNGW